MKKLFLSLSLSVLLMSSNTLADTWSVSERLVSGINYASGDWNVVVSGEKISGKADMQQDNGTLLTYSLDGSVSGGVYKVTLVGRDDGKKIVSGWVKLQTVRKVKLLPGKLSVKDQNYSLEVAFNNPPNSWVTPFGEPS